MKYQYIIQIIRIIFQYFFIINFCKKVSYIFNLYGNYFTKIFIIIKITFLKEFNYKLISFGNIKINFNTKILNKNFNNYYNNIIMSERFYV